MKVEDNNYDEVIMNITIMTMRGRIKTDDRADVVPLRAFELTRWRTMCKERKFHSQYWKFQIPKRQKWLHILDVVHSFNTQAIYTNKLLCYKVKYIPALLICGWVKMSFQHTKSTLTLLGGKQISSNFWMISRPMNIQNNKMRCLFV